MTWNELTAHIATTYKIPVVEMNEMQALFTPSPAVADPVRRQIFVAPMIRKIFEKHPEKAIATLLHEVGHLQGTRLEELKPLYARFFDEDSITEDEFQSIWTEELRAWRFAVQCMGEYHVSRNFIAGCLVSYQIKHRTPSRSIIEQTIGPMEELRRRGVPSRICTVLWRSRLLAVQALQDIVEGIRISRQAAREVAYGS